MMLSQRLGMVHLNAAKWMEDEVTCLMWMGASVTHAYTHSGAIVYEEQSTENRAYNFVAWYAAHHGKIYVYVCVMMLKINWWS